MYALIVCLGRDVSVNHRMQLGSLDAIDHRNANATHSECA